MFSGSRAIGRVAGILVALLFVLAPTSGVLAQEDGGDPTGGRTLHDLTFALTGDPAEVSENITAPTADRFYVLSAPQGTPGGSVPVDCSQPGGNPQAIGWVSEPILDQRSTLLGNGTLTIPVNARTQGTAPGLQTGSVTAELSYYWYHPDVNLHPHTVASGPQTVDGADISNPQTQASFEFDLDWYPDPAASSAGSVFFFVLELDCQTGTGLALDLSQASIDIGYVVGDPNDGDLDGDGIPDSLDDDVDGDGYTEAQEVANGTSDQDAAMSPGMDADGDGYTLAQENAAGTSDDDADDFPGAGGIPLGLIILIVLVVLVLIGGAFAALAVVNKPLKLTVSHDGFQAIEKGDRAAYEVTVLNATKKEEAIPVVLGLKGVPEDWTATLSPDQLELAGGEGAEAAAVSLVIVPPADAEYEEEAAIVVTATPTDAEGKTSAMRPGSSIKTKTIVNIGVTPEEGGGKAAGALGAKLKFGRRSRNDEDQDAVPDAEHGLHTDAGKAVAVAEAADAADEDEEDAKPKKRFGGFGKRKKGKGGDDETPAEAEAEAVAEETAAEKPATGAAAASTAGAATGKPRLAMGKMKHDPEDFTAGDEVTTTVAVQNKGDGAAEGLRLKLLVNDDEADVQEIDLAPGEVTKVEFKWTADADENRVKVKGEMPRRG